MARNPHNPKQEYSRVGKIDPITLEVVRGSLVSTVAQMRVTLMRTSYAPVLYECRDFSCGLMTANGELAAMSEDFSGHVFAMALGLNTVRDKFGDDIHPGDVLAVNDPYTGGTHMNDIAFYTPLFVDGEVIIFIAVRAHWADVGGATAGSFSGQDTEIYQEGVRLVPVKLIEQGRLNQGLWDVMFANMRLPEEREGDCLAMLDTAKVAEAELLHLCSKYGRQTIRQSIDALLDGAETVMRERISKLSDGEYRYEHYMDNGGLSPEPVPLKAKMTIEGDTIAFDFAGTGSQVTGPMNVGIPVSQGGVFVVVKSWLDPKTPVNGGTFRPLKFDIPKGICLAAQLPAAVGGCWEVYRQVQATTVGLFTQAIPDDPGGESLGTANHTFVSGFDKLRDRYYLLYEYPEGGSPASSETDGATGCRFYDGGDMPCVQYTESLEQRQPLLVEGMEARTDGESPGRFRSGFGISRRLRVLAETAELNVMADRAVIPPWGATGSEPGKPNGVTVVRQGREIMPSAIPGKIKSFPLQRGDVVVMQAAAGGGVGDPLERDTELVLQDASEGLITPQRARDAYGVVLDNGSVDLDKTRDLRRRLREQRYFLSMIEAQSDEFDERGCRICPLSPAAAGSIGVQAGDMVEYVSSLTAPLRAWVRIADELGGKETPLGPIARTALKLNGATEVWVRPLRITVPTA